MSGAPDGDALDAWWAELRSVALVGTARRAAPAVRALAGTEPRPVAPGPERQVLDGAAIAGVARRAGTVATTRHDPLPPAPTDPRPVAPRAAVQVLDLLLGQAPAVGVHRDELLAHWYETCAATGHRLPEALLVGALDQAAPATVHRSSLPAALGARGRWLAARNPRWAWAAGPDDATAAGGAGGPGAAPDPDDWARQPAPERLAVVVRLRAEDPGAARRLVQSTWSSDAAGVRAAHLGALAVGLSAADEELCERALDDRARSVREVAASLLDAIPTSARAGRMAQRLRPLVSRSQGRGGPALTVTLPDDPDTAAVRDGLGPPPPGRSARGWHLERIVAGTPLPFWTELGDEGPAAVLRLLEDGDGDVRRGLVAAALAQRDETWAAALFAGGRDPRLLAAVAPDRREPLVIAALRADAKPVLVPALLAAVPAPWTPELSALVVSLAREAAHPALFLQPIGPLLARGLDPAGAQQLEAWLAELQRQDDPPTQPSGALRAVLQHRSLHRAISEAFA